MSFAPKKYIAADTETTGLRVWCEDVMFSVALCDEMGETAYWEWPVDPHTRECTPLPEDVATLNEWFSGDYEYVFHNAKFDVCMLRKAGIHVCGVIHDTSIAARVCNNDEITYGLKDLAFKYLKIPADDEQDLKDAVHKARLEAQKINRRATDVAEMYLIGEESEADYWLPRVFDPNHNICERYCRQDTYRTMGLFLLYQSVMEEDEDLKFGYEDEMFRIWPVVMAMEDRGMRIDRQAVAAELVRAEAAADHHKQSMISFLKRNDLKPHKAEQNDEGKSSRKATKPPLTAEDFNPGSSDQLKRVLYNTPEEGGLGIDPPKYTDKGSPSTDKYALRELMHLPFVQDLQQYRGAVQSTTLFFQKYLDLMRKDETGQYILHPGLNQCGTTTFRFSCSAPNLQQVGNPRTAQFMVGHYSPRAPFGPRDGYKLYTADYKQQELRIFSSISNDPFLLEEIRAGRDPNNSCTNKAWGGEGNPKALLAAINSLELMKEEPSSPEIESLWQEVGWSSLGEEGVGLDNPRALEVARWWLEQFDYDIVEAEKSVGVSNSRGRAKCVMFAIIYGGGPSSVTELLYCTVEQSAEFIRDIKNALPNVDVYMQESILQCRKDGFIINPYGRKIRIDPEFAYKSVNYRIQSTAAIMMKDSLVRCHAYFKELGVDAHVLMTIHDEAIFEIRDGEDTPELLHGICDIMSDNGGRICIPMPVDLKVAETSWAQKVDVTLPERKEVCK